jgi:hypothetical protein
MRNLLVAFAAAILALPAQVAAQQTAPQVTDAQLAPFAKAFIEIGEARDRAQKELADPRSKTPEGLEALRLKLKEEIGVILRSNAMTLEEYERITYVVAFDEERRAAFERVLAGGTSAPVG